MKKPTILVTGAAGYIGSIATYLLLEKGNNVVAVDNLSKGYKKPIELLQAKFGKDRLRFFQVDIRDNLKSVLASELEIDAVLHYAAFCDVNESMNNPGKYFDNNVNATVNLLEFMVQKNIKHIVFSSTCAVYGNVTYMPVDEKHPIQPLSPYGASKYMAEEIIRWYGKLGKINSVIFRYFNVTGASDDGLIGDSKKPSSLLVQNVVRAVLGISPFKLTYGTVDTPDGSPIRDFIHVVDLNEAHIQAITYLLQGGESTTLNLGTGKGYSVLDILRTVEKVTGKSIEKTSGKKRVGEIKAIYANSEKAQKSLNWQSKRTLENAVTTLLTWYTQHPNGWGN